MDTTWFPGMTLEDMEKKVVEKCLRYNDNNKTKTAAMLGISIRGLDSKLERWNKPVIAEGKKNEGSLTKSN